VPEIPVDQARVVRALDSRHHLLPIAFQRAIGQRSATAPALSRAVLFSDGGLLFRANFRRRLSDGGGLPGAAPEPGISCRRRMDADAADSPRSAAPLPRSSR